MANGQQESPTEAQPPETQAAAVDQGPADLIIDDPGGADQPLSGEDGAAASGQAPSQAQPPAAIAQPEAFEIDLGGGRMMTVTKDQLIQTYRQFPGMQKWYTDSKAFVEAMRRWGVTPEQVPTLERLLLEVAKQEPSRSAPQPGVVQPGAARPDGSDEAMMEIGEFYPKFSEFVKGHFGKFNEAMTRLERMEGQLSGYGQQDAKRQQRETAIGSLSSIAQQVEALSGAYADLKDQAHSSEFLKYLIQKNPTIRDLQDQEILEGYYLRFNRDGIAKRLTAQAQASQGAQRETIAGAFGEGGGVRGTVSTRTPGEKEIDDLITDD